MNSDNLNTLFEKEEHSEVINQIRNPIITKDMTTEQLTKIVYQIYYKSRSLERLGQFSIALDTVANVRSSKKIVAIHTLNLTLIIAQMYSYWRLKNYDYLHDLSAEGFNILNELSLQEKEENSNWVSLFYNIFALICWSKDDLDVALKFFKKSLSIEVIINNSLSIARVKNNIGNTYLKMSKLKEANDFYKSALTLRKFKNNKPGIATSFNSFGRFYDKIKDYKTASNFHIDCLKLWEEIGNPQFIAKSNRFLGQNYQLQGLFDVALNFYTRSLNQFREIDNTIDIEATLNLIKGIRKNNKISL